MEATTRVAPEYSQVNTEASDFASKEKQDGIIEGSSQTTPEVDHGVVLKHGMKLHPQPTSDPLDPLNWSTARKNSILVILMALYFEFTYLTTTSKFVGFRLSSVFTNLLQPFPHSPKSKSNTGSPWTR